MTETRLRTTMSVFLVLAHLLVPLLVLGLFLAGGLTRSEFTTCLGMVVPMLAALTGLALGFVIRVKKKTVFRRRSAEVSGLYAFVTLVFPSLFVTAIAALIIMKAFNRGLTSFEDFKTALAGVETAFGAYTGKVISSLFEPQERETTKGDPS